MENCPLDQCITYLNNENRKYHCIHQLLLHNNKSYAEIVKDVPEHIEKNEHYKKKMLSVSNEITNTEGSKLFRLNPRFTSHFNSFYYNTYRERLDALKIYEDFYDKSLADNFEHDPIRLKNTTLKFFLETVRGTFVHSSLIHFLVNLIKLRNNFHELEEEVVEFALQ